MGEGGREGGRGQGGPGASAPGRDFRALYKDTARVTVHAAGVPVGSPSGSSVPPVTSSVTQSQLATWERDPFAFYGFDVRTKRVSELV